MSAPIYFLDIEASGLTTDSWPVEVGWCALDGEPNAVLIRPYMSWPRAAWSDRAEALHGLTIDMLEKKGVEVAAACKAVNKALAGARVYSDAPDWDGFWLYRLFDAAKIRQQFQLSSFADLLGGATQTQIDDARAAVDKNAPHRHRASPDVLHLRALYQQIHGARAL